jgi:MerR family redox-sensitive transcriptional activator SoxR
MPDFLTIGEVARRTGVATSALRFYEQRGLLRSERTESGQRRYSRVVIRRVSFIVAAQRVGLSLDEIRATLAGLPAGRTPTTKDWARLARSWRPILDQRIALLEGLRDSLDSCIGCGCLSLESCRLHNQGDTAGAAGPGARYLLGDKRPG